MLSLDECHDSDAETVSRWHVIKRIKGGEGPRWRVGKGRGHDGVFDGWALDDFFAFVHEGEVEDEGTEN